MTITEYDDCRQCGDTFPVGMLVDGVCRFCRETASEWLGRMRNPNTCNVDRRAVRHVESLLAEVKRLTPRVIETQAEVNALPAGAVVRENGPYPEAFVYEKYLDETECDYRWVYPGDSDPQIEPPLPVTVLYAPEGGEG